MIKMLYSVIRAAGLCLALSVVGHPLFAQPMTPSEKRMLLHHLDSTRDALLQEVEGLSDRQIAYRPDAGSWSIANCVEHLALAEVDIFSLFLASLEVAADPSAKRSVRFTDRHLLDGISNRKKKVKTKKDMSPTGLYDPYPGALEVFEERRAANIDFMKNCDEDLRDRYVDLPIGKVDAYQAVLFMSGHTTRHIKQIKEIKSAAGYPKS